MCFGTFDLLHLGHINYFQQAKKYGNYLIVVIARDVTKLNQQKKLIFNENERLFLLQQLKIVDEAVLGDVKDHFKVILTKKPDIICLGYDHSIEENELQNKLNELGLSCQIKRAKPFHPDKYKSNIFRLKLLK